MKKQIFTLLLLFAFFVMAFIPKDKGKTDYCGFNIKAIDKSVAKITDSLYAGKYEVCNLLYCMFRCDLIRNKKTELLKVTLPDSANWRDKLAYNEPMVELYYRHPAYRDYPVVNISYEAANMYCTWLTEKYNADPKRNFKKVLFRLPTEKEWEYAASGGTELSVYPWGPYLFQNGNFMCNYRRVGDECISRDSSSGKFIVSTDNDYMGVAGSLNDAADMPAPVASYFPNGFGLCNVCGNVAEMVQEKGISRGGGWKSTGAEVRIQSRAHYDKTATDLGFRYFMQVIEK